MLASPEPSVVSFAPLVRTSPLRLTICPFRRGYRVTPPLAPEGLADLMHARQVIEGANAELAAQRSGPAMLWALQSTVDELRRAPHGPSFAQYRAYWQADERFHRLIAESAGNPYLVEAYTALGGLVQRFRLFNGLGVTDADFAIAEHTAVLDALRSADAVAAREAMVAHIRGVLQRATHGRDPDGAGHDPGRAQTPAPSRRTAR